LRQKQNTPSKSKLGREGGRQGRKKERREERREGRRVRWKEGGRGLGILFKW
jgi:hypothetical protein